MIQTVRIRRSEYFRHVHRRPHPYSDVTSSSLSVGPPAPTEVSGLEGGGGDGRASSVASAF